MPYRAALTALCWLVLAAAPVRAGADVLWRGDFETGDRSQWDRAQEMSADRLQVVTDPVRQGRYALRAEVRQGDDPIGASGNRNELVKMSSCSEGQERYYAWSTLWPADYPLTPTWQVFTQWHHSGSSGAPPVRFVLGCSAADCGVELPDTMFFIVNGTNVWTMSPLVRGVWHDFVLHVMWSSSAGVGFVELWYDGELVVPLRSIATLFPGQTNYLKMGLYRDAATQPTAVLYHDGMVEGTTLDDVWPGPPPDGGVDPAAGDAGAAPDAGSAADGGAAEDGEAPRDAGAGPDAGALPDGGPAPPDSDDVAASDVGGGCRVGAAGGPAAGALALLVLLALTAGQAGRRRH